MEKWSVETPMATAFLAPGYEPISYNRLYTQVLGMMKMIDEKGLGKGHRVAIAGSNGLALAVSSLAIMAACKAVPLNPSLTIGELQDYLVRLDVDVLIYTSEAQNAYAAATQMGLSAIQLEDTSTDSELFFRLIGEFCNKKNQVAELEGIALIMQTSGTTGIPKTILISHPILKEVAFNTTQFMGLTCRDRGLNCLPLFHIHALSLNILGSISVGGSMVFIPKFGTAQECLSLLQNYSCTWMTTGSAQLTALTDYVKENPEVRPPNCLRMLGGGGSAIRPEVFSEIEKVFNVPLLYGWGMTETAGTATCNPPLGKRKPASAGVSIGCEVAIVGTDGRQLRAMEVGEVVLRGKTLACIVGEERSEDEWMPTGDEGYLDEDQYLFITGRIKEFINKGGQKVSPYEIEEVFLRHPSVAEAVAFAIPHPRVGEDVAAAIVLEPGAILPEAEARLFAAQYLAAFKIPSRILAINKLPRNATGKLMRAKMASILEQELSAQEKRLPSGDRCEEEMGVTLLVNIWREALKPAVVTEDTDFFAVGGDSLSAAIILADIEATWGLCYPLSIFLEYPTLRALSEQIKRSIEGERKANSLVILRQSGSQSPLFCVHAVDGEILVFRNLLPHVPENIPVYGLQFLSAQSYSISIVDLAEEYVDSITAVQPDGPFYIAGYCLGGWIALEMARLLRERNREVAFIALFDSPAPTVPTRTLLDKIKRRQRKSFWSIQKFWEKPVKEWADHFINRIGKELVRLAGRHINHAKLPETRRKDRILREAAKEYVPPGFSGEVLYIQAEQHEYDEDPKLLWQDWFTSHFEVVTVPGMHDSILHEPQIRCVAAALTKRLKALQCT